MVVPRLIPPMRSYGLVAEMGMDVRRVVVDRGSG